MPTTFAGRYGPEGFTDNYGNRAPQAEVHLYQVGTTTPVALWADRDRDDTLANPLPHVAAGDPGMGADGNGSFFADPGLYRMVVLIPGLVGPEAAGAVFDDLISIAVDPDEEAAASKTHYHHDQAMPAVSWTVVHGLGYHPSVYAEDSAGTMLSPQIFHLDLDTTRLDYVAATDGFADFS